MTRRHEGEQAIQERVGEGGEAWGSPMFDADLPPAFGAFLAAQPAVILAAVDSAGARWSTMLQGPPGFAAPRDSRTVVLDALPGPQDALHGAFEREAGVGLVTVDFARRRRIRINGRARRQGDQLVVVTEQVLGNCPKYIVPRVPVALHQGEDDGVLPRPRRTTELTDDDRAAIRAADTFFIASSAPGHGADSSHRGGPAGFVAVDGGTLRWPDFLGNSFYMTFGNLHLDHRCGLLFPNWQTGELLQLTGTAGLENFGPHGSPAELDAPGRRTAVFTVREVARSRPPTWLSWIPLPR